MRIALILEVNDEVSDGGRSDYFKTLTREFVHGNTLLFDRAEIQEIADAGDLARDEPTTVLRLVGKAERLL